MLWDLNTIGYGRPLRDRPQDIVYALAFSPDGETLAVASNAAVELRALPSGKLLHSHDENGVGAHLLQFDRAGAKIAVARSWQVALRRVPGWGQTAVFGEEGLGIDSFAMTRDETLLATGDMRWRVTIWGVPTSDRIAKCEGHIGQVTCLAFSPDGKMLASGSQDETVRLWSVPDGNTAGLLWGHRLWLVGLRFSEDGSRLLSLGADYTLRTWDTRTGEARQTVVLGRKEAVATRAARQ